jgi:hypothetical protein
MAGSRRQGRWIVPAAAVTVLLALSGASVAIGAPAGGGSALPPPDTCIAPILPCYIVLSIDSGSHGNRETVTGARFWPGEPFTVYFWNGSTGAPAAAVASGSTGVGDFSVSFTVPKDPVGNYTVFVTDLAGDNQSAVFHLTHLGAHPGSGPVAGTTSVSGQGFLPDHVVKFHVHGAHADTAQRCETNRYGNFSDCRVTIPTVPTGSTRLTATDGTYTARIDFVVN